MTDADQMSAEYSSDWDIDELIADCNEVIVRIGDVESGFEPQTEGAQALASLRRSRVVLDQLNKALVTAKSQNAELNVSCPKSRPSSEAFWLILVNRTNSLSTAGTWVNHLSDTVDKSLIDDFGWTSHPRSPS